MAWLANQNNQQELVRRETGREIITHYPNDGELPWGAIVRMTVEFIRELGRCEMMK